MEASSGISRGSMIFWAIIGVVVSVMIGLVVYFIIGRAETRPVKQGFYGGAITGSSNLSCGRMSSEAEQLYSLFASKNLKGAEEGSADLRDLKNLLSKLCCFKQDLMAPQQTITAVKELGFSTQQDIQPLGDLTGRCFSKTIPERDLSLQFIKWRDAGSSLIHRLCTQGNLSEAEVLMAENLFMALWRDVNDVANVQCLTVLPKEKMSRRDPQPSVTEDVVGLKEYDGLY
jgi:hypothetical protein